MSPSARRLSVIIQLRTCDPDWAAVCRLPDAPRLERKGKKMMLHESGGFSRESGHISGLSGVGSILSSV